MDFRTALSSAITDLTPRPWEHTTNDGTLTVIPAGLPEAPGAGEVYVRITLDKTHAAQCAVTTTDLPALIAALSEPITTDWELIAHWPDGTPKPALLDGGITLTPTTGGFTITVTEETSRTSTVTAGLTLPNQERLPLASALRRALDVARSWER